MKNYRTVLFALLSASPIASLTARAISLSEVEQHALNHDQRLQAARQDIRIANARLTQSEAQNGWNLMATTTGGTVNNNENGHNYTAYGYSVGASYPLLGTRAKLQKQVNDARQNIEVAQTKTDMLILQSLFELRQAYINQWFYEQQAKLARDFLKERNQDTQYLDKRLQQKLLLESDAQNFLSAFAEADVQAQDAKQLASVAQQTLILLTGLPAEQFQKLDVPDLDVVLQNGQSSSAEVLPNVRLARQLWENQQQQLKNPAWKSVDASVSVAYSDGRDGFVLGVPSHSAQVALNVRMPLEVGKLKQGIDEEALAQLNKNQAEYEQSRVRFALDTKQALADYYSALASLHSAEFALKGARQALHERNLRSQALAEDELEKRLQARYNYYRMARQELEGWRQWQLGSIKLASLGFSLRKTHVAYPIDIAEPLLAKDNESTEPKILMAMADSPFKSDASSSQVQVASSREKSSSAEAISQNNTKFAVTTGSYMWNSEAALQEPEAQVKEWSRYGLMRMLVGLNRKQIEDTALVSHMAQLVNVAHKNHIKIELLLGDSSWIQPQGRAELIALVKRLSPLKVDGLNLDLEIEQLPQWQQQRNALTEDWLASLKATAKIAPWPLTATFHHRHLDFPNLGSRLLDAGVAEAAVMIFSTNSSRVLDVVNHAHQVLNNVPFAVVQSVEAQLPSSESYARVGLVPLVELSLQLQQHAQTTLLLQSWEDLRRLKP